MFTELSEEQVRKQLLTTYRVRRMRGMSPIEAAIDVGPESKLLALNQVQNYNSRELRNRLIDEYIELVRERVLAPGLVGGYWYNGCTSEARQRRSEARKQAVS